MTDNKTVKQPAKNWAMEKIGKPFIWFAIGFVSCKIIDAYTENKRVKRIAS